MSMAARPPRSLSSKASTSRPECRRRGVARALVDAIVDWARGEGLSEFASDALLDNTVSHAMHAALGFAETERVVYFRRALTEP